MFGEVRLFIVIEIIFKGMWIYGLVGLLKVVI